MADEDNSMTTSEAGKKSGGQFGKPGGADPHEAGRKGAQAQPTEAKREGGRNSHSGGRRSDDNS